MNTERNFTGEEMRFFYFETHDTDQNLKLDGLEFSFWKDFSILTFYSHFSIPNISPTSIYSRLKIFSQQCKATTPISFGCYESALVRLKNNSLLYKSPLHSNIIAPSIESKNGNIGGFTVKRKTAKSSL